MRNHRHAPSTTSLPRSPRDAADARSTRYLIMMAARILCFILMVVITPYGWYTWIFGAAAVLLPYFAVVDANVDDKPLTEARVDPERALPASASERPVRAEEPLVIRVEETPGTTAVFRIQENPPPEQRP
ncbi:DUF3099 domain-containing protein [Microbacterium aurantiacum]|nr:MULTISPECIES: DUF3099 domain-containing protein [Microbacterium]ANG85610.1 hypothetical protein A8L33_09595 [Microbacterium chocolatum]